MEKPKPRHRLTFQQQMTRWGILAWCLIIYVFYKAVTTIPQVLSSNKLP